MNSATCPHCGASFSRTYAGCAIWMSALFLVGIWAAYWKSGQYADVSLCVWLSLGALGIAGYEVLRTRRLRRAEIDTLEDQSISPENITRFWQHTGRTPGPAHAMHSQLGARLAGNAQSLRRKWLTSKAEEVETELKWAAENCREAFLFARTESAMIKLGESGGMLFGLAIGGLRINPEIAAEHSRALSELNEIYREGNRVVASRSGSDITSALRELLVQIRGVLVNAKRMYS